MRNCLLLFLNVWFLISCKPIQVIKENYLITENIILQDFYFVCYTSERIYMDRINNDCVGEISPFFFNSIAKLNINLKLSNMSENCYTSDVWLSKKNKRYYNHNKIDTNYLLKQHNLKGNQNPVLIPIIYFSEKHVGNEGGSIYNQHIGLSIFVLANNKIIYSNSIQRHSKGFFYVDEEEKQQIDKTSFFTQEDWDNLVQEVMQPYIDRLK